MIASLHLESMTSERLPKRSFFLIGGIMMKKTIFLTVWNISTKPSAINRSVFKQANTFVKNGYNPVILTFDYSFDYPQIERELHALGSHRRDKCMHDTLHAYRRSSKKSRSDTASREF